MKKYSIFERQLANFLEKFPQVKQIVKITYQRINYWCFGDRNFTRALHPRVKILTPFQWANIEPKSQELFFGYYDKSPWSSDMCRMVFHRFRDDHQLDIMVFDRDLKKASVVGTTKTWSSQQGSMAQWLPSGNRDKLIFNDLVGDKFGARILLLEEKAETTIPFPIQTLHPNGREALSLNYKRLERMRPEYGYSIAADNFSSDLALSEDGIWHIDLESGQSQLILSLATLIAYKPCSEMTDSKHKVNHIMYSPQGSKYVFMHRWISSNGKFSRLYVANNNNNDSLKLLLDDRMVSHYYWHDEEHLLVWARTNKAGDHYYLINVISGERQIIGEEVLDAYGDGHPSFSPDRRWILTDSYPDKARQQHLQLYDLKTGKIIEIGRFFAPWQFYGSKRCDLHPRWSPDGKLISIDSTHEGKRMTYILDVSSLVN